MKTKSSESNNCTERPNWSSFEEAPYRNPDMSQNLKKTGKQVDL